MCKECTPSVPAARLLDRSIFGDSFDSFENAASEKIQEIISLGGGLMWNDAAVCGGIMVSKILTRD